ncbi:MAG TPA: hypothetical protein VHD56_11425 [Tepidisphaeraceae bacterium]|nr:hypothetical protein [Tepidisphaeraceae bacterium]
MNEPRSSNGVPSLVAIGVFSALSIAAAITSQGFLEADACTHYMYARFAFQHPYFFIDIWARPVCTFIYSIPAVMAGRAGTQFTCLLIAIGCGLVAFRIAQKRNFRWPVLALIFTFAQPLLFLHSFNELTELPFALLLGLGFLAYVSRWWWAFALVIGLTPLSRPEGFGFLLLGALALIAHRRWIWLPLLALPLVAWDVAGWMAFGEPGHWWRWLIDNWPFSAISTYERGPFYYFVSLLPVFTGPLLLPFACVGLWLCVKPLRIERLNDLLLAAIPLSMLFGHSLLYATGRMASNGEPRYMLIVAPFWALLAARGWEYTFAKLNWPEPIRLAGLAAILPIMANNYYRVIPLKLTDDWVHARDAAQWYQHASIAKNYPHFVTAHQGIYYFLGTMGTTDWRRDALAVPTPGTLIVWDPMYAIYNSDQRRVIHLDDLTQSGWLDITEKCPKFGPDWHVLISPGDVQNRPAGSLQ